jgi:putative membrane protein
MSLIWIEQRWGGGDPLGTRPWFVALLIRWAINAVALVAAAVLIPGIELHGWASTIIAAALFGLVNAVIRPLVMCITCLLQLLTLGLFTLIVNAAMLALTASLGGALGLDFEVHGFWSAFFGALVITLASMVLTRLVSRVGPTPPPPRYAE